MDDILKEYCVVLIPTDEKLLEHYGNMPTWTAGCLEKDIFASAYTPEKAISELVRMMKAYFNYDSKYFMNLPPAPPIYHEHFEKDGKEYVLEDNPFCNVRTISNSLCSYVKITNDK